MHFRNFDLFQTNVSNFNRWMCSLIWDFFSGIFGFTGQEDYERLRPLSYPNVSTQFVCLVLWQHFNQFMVFLFIFFANRRTACWYAIRYQAEHLSTTCCQNGIQKFDITCRACQSSLLVSLSKSIAIADERDLEFYLNKKHTPNCCISGTKSDLRVPGSEKFVSVSEAKKLKSKIKAAALVECSAIKKQHLEDVFHEAIRAVAKKPKKSTPQCSILWNIEAGTHYIE